MLETEIRAMVATPKRVALRDRPAHAASRANVLQFVRNPAEGYANTSDLQRRPIAEDGWALACGYWTNSFVTKNMRSGESDFTAK
jgi:hypothetical protein